MNVYAMLSIIAVVIYLYLGVHVLIKENSKSNKVFFGLCLTWAAWAFFYSFIFYAQDKETVLFWYKLTSLGWCTFSGFSLHFALVLSKREQRINKYIRYPFLYLPGIISSVLVISGFPLVAKDFTHVNGLWFEVASNSIPSIVFYTYLASYNIISGLIVFHSTKRGKLKRDKKMGNIFLIGILLGFTPGMIVNSLLPSIGIMTFPAVGYLFASLWLIGIEYSIIKYNLMSMSTSIAADAMMARIKDIIFLVDGYSNILKVNTETLSLLEYTEHELRAKPIAHLSDEYDLMQAEFAKMKQSSIPTPNIEMTFRTKGGNPIPVTVSGAAIHDRAEDLLGVVVVAQDIRPTLELKKLNSALEAAQLIADKDMKMAINVQANLFPQEPPQTKQWDTAFVFKPASGVSGDMFDFYMRGEELSGASLFDVSGHGIASGLITMLAKSTVFRSFQAHGNHKLNEIFDTINKNLIREIGNVDNYLTGILLRFKDDAVEYVNAAHTELIYKIAASGNVAIVNRKDRDIKGMFLGKEAMQWPFEMLKFRVSTGDTLVLYSDCLIESKNSSGEEYGMDNVTASLRSAPSDASAGETLAHLMRDFTHFMGERKLADDLTVLVLKKRS